MEVIKIFISFLPAIILGFFYLLTNKKKVNINTLTNIFLVSFVLILLSSLLNKVTLVIAAGIYLLAPNIMNITWFWYFFRAFFTAGLCEEISKWIGIKILKPKNKREIVIFAIFVSTFLACIENNSFIQKHGLITGIYRASISMHIIFQIIMSYFMVKAFTKKEEGKKTSSHLLQILAILVPSIAHGIFDAIFWDLQIESISILVPIILGIIIYGITFWTLYKYRDNNTEEENVKKASIFKIIFAILIFVFQMCAFWGFNDNRINSKSNDQISNNGYTTIASAEK